MYDIFFTSTNFFFLSLVFSIMVLLLTLIIFMAQLSCAGHSLTYPLLIWRLSGMGDALQTERRCVSFAICSLWGWWGRRRRGGIIVASSALPCPTSLLFVMRMDSDHGQNWSQVREPLFLWHPRSAVGRRLPLLINALPAVRTNSTALMYAHALSFSPFHRLHPSGQM